MHTTEKLEAESLIKKLPDESTFNEAVECFFSDYQVRRNKRYSDRYQLISQTIGDGSLRLFFNLNRRILSA